MRIKPAIFLVFLLAGCLSSFAQNSTFSPYSRYGLGEIPPSTFAHNAGMGGAYIALKPDSTVPVFINAGNPAAYSLIRLTTLEVGGRFGYSNFRSGNSSLNKWGTNFSYGALGFPIRNNGGACFGITPYSYVGYEMQSVVSEPSIGNVTYKFNGDGGLNKAFLGYGIMPFNKRLVKFKRRYQYIPDSVKHLGRAAFKIREFNSKLLSDLAIGVNANYIFGSIGSITRVVYPNSLLYNNTFRSRDITLGDFTGNFGAQTAITIDSVLDHKGRKARIREALKKLNERKDLPEDVVKSQTERIRDSIPLHRRAYKERLKFTVGYFSNINNQLAVKYSNAAYNYILSGTGQEILKDTAYASYDQNGKITLPLEQGFGIGFKKGERINIVADFAITGWSRFKFLNDVNTLKDNYRVALGVNYVPEKFAGGRGSFYKRVNYRLGGSYNTGHINISNTLISDYSISAGMGIPVGANRYVWSMVNVALQYGQVGGMAKGQLKENYYRIHFGFTFSDRWFQKFRYD